MPNKRVHVTDVQILRIPAENGTLRLEGRGVTVAGIIGNELVLVRANAGAVDVDPETAEGKAELKRHKAFPAEEPKADPKKTTH